jgi:Tfp pilus assembly protein PilO
MAKAQAKTSQSGDNFFSKIAKLKSGAKNGILAGGIAVLAGGFYMQYWQPYDDNRKSLEGEVAQLTEAVGAEKRNIAKHKPIAKYVNPVDDTFNYLQGYLTSENEIPRLMQIISDIASQSGTRVTFFAPKRPVLQPHYAVIDFTINLEGPFLNVLKFLYTLSKMERIINVKTVAMSSPVMGANMLMSLSVRCDGSTYRKLTEDEAKQVAETAK